MNIKYISLTVLRITVISRVRRRVKFLMFSTYEMKYFWYLPKKKSFFLSFLTKRNNGKQTTSKLTVFSLILLDSARLMGIIVGVDTIYTYKMICSVILMNEY